MINDLIADISDKKESAIFYYCSIEYYDLYVMFC